MTGPAGRTVVDAMLRAPKVCGPATTIAEARDVLRNDHVHAVLITDAATLLAVVERPDLDAHPLDLPAHAPALLIGRLTGRVIGPDADLEATRRAMTRTRRRRLAVVGGRGEILGLLCLKRTGLGFCSAADVRARAAERRTNALAAATTSSSKEKHP